MCVYIYINNVFTHKCICILVYPCTHTHTHKNTHSTHTHKHTHTIAQQYKKQQDQKMREHATKIAKVKTDRSEMIAQLRLKQDIAKAATKAEEVAVMVKHRESQQVSFRFGVFMPKYMYVYAYAYVCVIEHVCVVNILTLVYAFVYMYINEYIYTDEYVQIYPNIRIHMNTYMCVFIE